MIQESAPIEVSKKGNRSSFLDGSQRVWLDLHTKIHTYDKRKSCSRLLARQQIECILAGRGETSANMHRV